MMEGLSEFVVPAQAGTQEAKAATPALDPRFRASEEIGIEDAITKFSPRRPGESQDPSHRHAEVFKQWQSLTDPARFVLPRDGPRLSPGWRENERL